MAEHVEAIKDSKFNRQRASTDDLRKKCKNGYMFVNSGVSKKKGKSVKFSNAAGQSAFHHVLPITSCQDANMLVDSDTLEYIHDCMAATVWDINDTPNLIGLPLKPVYMAADRFLSADDNTVNDLKALNPKKGGFGAIPELPCHQNDHASFNEGIIDYLNANIWKTLKPSDPCKSKSEDIKALLDKGSKKFTKWLEARGKQNGGAIDCWVNREAKEKTWHIPFSMKIGKPSPTPPPPRLVSQNRKAWMKSLFERL